MQLSGILIFLVVLAAGTLAFVLIARYLHRRAETNTPKLPLIAKSLFKSTDPSVRSPACSMAARREDI